MNFTEYSNLYKPKINDAIMSIYDKRLKNVLSKIFGAYTESFLIYLTIILILILGGIIV